MVTKHLVHKQGYGIKESSYNNIVYLLFKVKKLNDFGKKRNTIEYQVNELKGEKKLLLSAANKIMKRKEQIPHSIKSLNDEYIEDMVETEKLRKITLKKLENELEEMLKECRKANFTREEEQRLEKESKKFQMDMQRINNEKSDAEARYKFNKTISFFKILLHPFYEYVEAVVGFHFKECEIQ